MMKKKGTAWRHCLAGILALVFLSAGTVLAAPNDTAPSAAPDVLPVLEEDLSDASKNIWISEAEVPTRIDQAEGTEQISSIAAARTDAAPVKEIDKAIARADASWSFTYSDYLCTIITGYRGTLPQILVIPDGVKEIEGFAFANNNDIVSVVIPDSVTRISDGYDRRGAFSGCSSLKSVTIGNGVEHIGKYAFTYCRALEDVTLGTSLETIEKYAFWNCSSLNSIEIPNTKYDVTICDSAFLDSGVRSVSMGNRVKTIEGQAFQNCRNLSTVTLGSTLETIAPGAFAGCLELAEIVIPDSVKSIALPDSRFGAFSNCRSLKRVVIGNGIKLIGTNTFNGCEALEAVTFGTSLETIESSAFSGLRNLKSVEIPETKSDLTIGPSAFSGSGIGSVTLANSVKSIGPSTFSRCLNLRNVSLGNGLETIGANAFANCPKLTEIIIPDSVTSIDSADNRYDGAFQGCSSLKWAVIGDGVRLIGSRAFYDCKALEEVTLGTSLETIGSGAFRNCSDLKSIEIPNTESDLIIESWAFNRSGISSVTIGNHVRNIGPYAFAECPNLNTVTLGTGLETIEEGAFQSCPKLTEIVVPDSVTSIGSVNSSSSYVFSGCTSLRRVAIGNGVKWIGYAAFSGCKALEEVALGTALETIGGHAFYDCTDLKSIEIPDTKSDLTIESRAFSRSGISSVTMGNHVRNIGPHAFAECSNLNTVTLGAGLETIEEGAFQFCPKLTEIVVPDSVTSLGSIDTGTGSVFQGCRGLKRVVIGNGVKWIGPSAFRNCYELEEATLGNAVETLGKYVFAECSSLSKIVLGNGLKTIEEDAFAGCAFTELVLPDSLESIGEDAFAGCALTKTVLPGSLRSIGVGAFASCALTQIVVPGSLQSIGSTSANDAGVFQNCRSLQRAAVLNGITDIGQNMFRNCDKLEEVFLSRNLESISRQTFTGCSMLRRILFGGTESDWNKIADNLELSKDTVVLFNASEPSWISQAEPTPAATPTATATSTPTVTPTAIPTSTTTPTNPGVVPAPEIPAVPGYQGGMTNGRTYYAKTSGASMMYYQKRSSGSLGRVSAPYVTAADGTRYYPINWGGMVLYPRLTDGMLSAYCIYSNGLEIPVFRSVASADASAGTLQTFALNGRQYHVRTSGASMLFYQKKSSGALGRVSAPFVTAADGLRYYPVNCGGTVLAPQLANGSLSAYVAGEVPVLTPSV